MGSRDIGMHDISTDEETPLVSTRVSINSGSSNSSDKSAKASWFVTSLIMANIVMGTGLLNFPSAYKDAGGIAWALCVEVVALVLVQSGMLLINYCSSVSGMKSYQDVVTHFCGPFGSFWANLLIVIHDWGTCVTFLVIIGDQFDQVMVHAYGSTFCHRWYMNRNFTITAASVLLILPFCFPKNMTSFRFGSMVGILTTVYLFILVIYKYFSLKSQGLVDNVVVRTRPVEWVDIFKVVPTIMFSFEAHVESVPLFNSMAKRSIMEFFRCIISSSIISVVVYNLVGVFGYLTFGEDVNSDFLTSYSPIDVPIIIGMTMMALKAIMTYPSVFFCARLVLMERSSDFCQRVLHWSEKVQRCVITVILFSLSVAIALSVPNIGATIALLGGSAAIFIFVFPGVCYVQVFLHPKNLREKIHLGIGCFYTIFGTFLVVTTTGYAISRYLDGELSRPEVQCT